MNNYFVGVGAQKAGTTWLANYFNKHPEVAFSPIKEVHHFDARTIKIHEYWDTVFINRLRKRVRTLEKQNLNANWKKNILALSHRIEMIHNPDAYIKYLNWFTDKEKISGEITPAYSLLDKNGFELIKRTLPGVKIIVLLRDPIERHWSNLRYLKDSRGFDPEKIFKDSFDDFQFYERSNYKRFLENLFAVFDRESVFISFYENLFNEEKSGAEIKSLCNFLNVKFKQPEIQVRKNSSKSMKLSEEHRNFGIKALKETYTYMSDNYDIPPAWESSLKYL